jgi:hypothetical protein
MLPAPNSSRFASKRVELAYHAAQHVRRSHRKKRVNGPTRIEQTNYVPRSSWINYIGTKGHIVEYFGGLSASKCAGTLLGVTFKFPGGMVLEASPKSSGPASAVDGENLAP